MAMAAATEPLGTPVRGVQDGAQDGARPVKFACRSVWKIFGDGAAQFLVRTGQAPTAADLAGAGLIGAVRDVTLEIGSGEIFVIMGLSGSGKSTLVRCMSRLIEPTAGEITFEERDLLKFSQREMIALRRHKMGMVFQHFALLPHLTVLGNVAFPLEVQGVPRRTREKSALEVIELVGLAGRERYFPRQLSGGQQQRVGIARSLVVKPEIWLLDEPFSALDPLIRREMQDEFLRLQNMLNKTIVFITHDFDEASLARCLAPMKVSLRRAAMAAMRRACPTGLTAFGDLPGRFLPPLILVPGASASQEQKCWAEGKASGPISEVSVPGPIGGDRGEVDAHHLPRMPRWRSVPGCPPLPVSCLRRSQTSSPGRQLPDRRPHLPS